jgi:hypothetical protein
VPRSTRERPVTAAPPGAPDLSCLPRRVTRRQAADLLGAHFFPVSPRTLEVWPLGVTRVNNRALIDTAELLAEARRRLDAAPRIRSGRRDQGPGGGG